MIVKPETLIGWHRKGFQLFWRWKCQHGRPSLSQQIRELIRQMVRENPTWGQVRIASELSLELGISLTANGAEVLAVVAKGSHQA